MSNRTLADILDENRRRYEMATRSAGIGAGPSFPVGDRPGTTSVASQTGGWWQHPVTRAYFYAAVSFGVLVFLHVARENQFR